MKDEAKDLLQMIKTCSKNSDSKLTFDSGCCKCLLDYIDSLDKEKEQLKTILGNQVRIKDELSEKIEKIRELVENSDWRLDDVHDLIDGYNEIAKVIN